MVCGGLNDIVLCWTDLIGDIGPAGDRGLCLTVFSCLLSTLSELFSLTPVPSSPRSSSFSPSLGDWRTTDIVVVFFGE